MQATGTATVVIGALIPELGTITIALFLLIIVMMADGVIDKS